jgi:hypothetical protein
VPPPPDSLSTGVVVVFFSLHPCLFYLFKFNLRTT